MDITGLYFDLPENPTEQDIKRGIEALVEMATAKHGGLYSICPSLPETCYARIIENGDYRIRHTQAFDIKSARMHARLDLLLIDLDKEVARGAVKLV